MISPDERCSQAAVSRITRPLEPILDYHCHLPPKDIAANRQFENLFEIWLEGDHYKWRAMRANGVDERYMHRRRRSLREIPGVGRDRPAHAAQPALPLDAPRTGALFRNRRTAGRIHRAAHLGRSQRAAAEPELRRKAILKKFDVQRSVHHRRSRPTICGITSRSPPIGCHAKVFPAFRPDKALNVHMPEIFNDWVAKLEAASGRSVRNYREFLDALGSAARVLSRDGLPALRSRPQPLLRRFLSASTVAAQDFRQGARGGRPATAEGARAVRFLPDAVLRAAGRGAKGWTKQLHLGALRNNSSRMAARPGPGYRLRFDRRLGRRPRRWAHTWIGWTRRMRCRKMILYNVNPADNYMLATMIGNFQGGRHPGQDAVRQRLVVPRPKGRHRVADQRALERAGCCRASSAC